MNSAKTPEYLACLLLAFSGLFTSCSPDVPDRITARPPAVTQAVESSSAQTAAEPLSLQVKISGIKGTDGVIRLAAFGSSDGFPAKHEKATYTRVLPASQGTLLFTLEKIVPGTYALAVIHDANDNGKLDTNWVGMPTEGFGASNDAPARFGPPGFEDAHVELPQDPMSITITMRYP